MPIKQCRPIVKGPGCGEDETADRGKKQLERNCLNYIMLSLDHASILLFGFDYSYAHLRQLSFLQDSQVGI